MAPITTKTQYCFIDGSFEELALELATYLNISSEEIAPLLENNKKDDVLHRLVSASVALNSIPERDFTAAYNLLIYLVNQSPKINNYLQPICTNLLKPITSSPIHGPGLALNALTTVFNLLAPDNQVRGRVFQTIVRLVRANGLFDTLRSQLKNLDNWILEWKMDEDEARNMYILIADVAEENGQEEESYQFILKALRTYDKETEELDAEEEEQKQKLAIRALKISLLSSTHFDFHDLTSLSAIQSLSESHPIYSELLDIFSEKELEDYNDFRDEHEGFTEEEGLDNSTLHRKMRLLTLPSLAASTSRKELEYKRIAKALQIPSEDVEMWVIDVIRAGLVEGKLSQQKQMFLIHRTTYRVFGEKQWREVATRLDQWKESLRSVKEVIAREREGANAQKERDQHEVDRKAAGATGMGAGRRPAGRDNVVEMGTD
ncbi:hypothetical protein BJ878DRAFT_519648 [Calycina marina]|uniref:Eukaryotic translation initiation factor 3 subunit M n=1 Tax=Calycina marina TaxID=1763456 RepID=A0A9P7YX56_9HELO|nr:hypothetical protein BJ878DRAFT_519648 [Calycina marina]